MHKSYRIAKPSSSFGMKSLAGAQLALLGELSRVVPLNTRLWNGEFKVGEERCLNAEGRQSFLQEGGKGVQMGGVRSARAPQLCSLFPALY